MKCRAKAMAAPAAATSAGPRAAEARHEEQHEQQHLRGGRAVDARSDELEHRDRRSHGRGGRASVLPEGRSSTDYRPEQTAARRESSMQTSRACDTSAACLTRGPSAARIRTVVHFPNRRSMRRPAPTGCSAAPTRAGSRSCARRRNLPHARVRRRGHARHRGGRRPLPRQPLPLLPRQGRAPVLLPGPHARSPARRVVGGAPRRRPAARPAARLAVTHVLCLLDEVEGSAAHLEVDALPPRLRALIVAKRDRYERGVRALVPDGIRGATLRASDAASSRAPSSARSTGPHTGFARKARARRNRSPSSSPTTPSPGSHVRRRTQDGIGLKSACLRTRHRSTMFQLALTVNGEPAEVAFAPYKTLLEVLREDLNLCGTKHGCELGECGACAVLLDGRPVLSCLVLGVECERPRRSRPSKAWPRTAGCIRCRRLRGSRRRAVRLLHAGIPRHREGAARRASESDARRIREALAGCLCRCTGYQQIFEAVEAAVGTSAPSGQRGERPHEHHRRAPPPRRRPGEGHRPDAVRRRHHAAADAALQAAALDRCRTRGSSASTPRARSRIPACTSS